MGMIHILDLHFLGSSETIASFLVETPAGPVLIESGPESTFQQLVQAVAKTGYSIHDIKHVFLTHIHFDHAGAAWKLAELGARIYVHPKGAMHLASPERLWDSAAKIYGEQMEMLWGRMAPIDVSLLTEVQDGQVIPLGDKGIKALHTPGHAVHHISWKYEDIIFTGDIAGVKIKKGPVVPPCPPPDINLEHWETSIQYLISQKASSLYLTHYGKVTDIEAHFLALKTILADWSEWIKKAYDAKIDQVEVVPRFMEYAKNQLKQFGVDEELTQMYEYANPSWMSVAGLYRYWKLKEEGKI
jgi:glyoxylase-like metal-dependent hydrolase (beta-lactamase superfamily II)